MTWGMLQRYGAFVGDQAETEGRPGFGDRAGLALALLGLYGSMAFVAFVYPGSGFGRVFDELGMVPRDLPFTTRVLLWFCPLFRTWWWAIGPGILLLAYLAWHGLLGRRGWKSIAFVGGIAVILPALAWMSVQMPLYELNRALHR
jgi:hypothetical protein